MFTTFRPVNFILSAVVLSSLAACAPAQPAQVVTAPSPSAAPVVLPGETREARGRIETVDPQSREILVRVGSRLTTVVAGPEIVNFNQMHAGDNVLIRYRSAVAAEIAPARSADPTGGEVVVAGAARGQRPAGAVGGVVTARVTFLSYNANLNEATVRTRDGRTVVLEVRRPEMREFASSLRAGQAVDLTYAEAVAVSVTPMTAAQRGGRRAD